MMLEIKVNGKIAIINGNVDELVEFLQKFSDTGITNYASNPNLNLYSNTCENCEWYKFKMFGKGDKASPCETCERDK